MCAVCVTDTAVMTPRQVEIIRMLRQGMSNKAIAGALGISEGTVKNHVTDIMRVLNVSNRTQAAQLDRTNMLDIEEYLHLAIHASSVGNHHACMTYLKEVLQQQPANALALYLLAVQHAELGLNDRAAKGLRASLAIRPDLEMARFQLGVMLLDKKRFTEAKEQFAALGASRVPALRTYCEGMMAVADDDLALAREKIVLGLSVQDGNPALAALMRRVLERLSREKAPEAIDPPEPLFLGAYRQTSR